MIDIKSIYSKWHILIAILPFLLGVFVFKIFFHYFGLEIITLNALFTSLIAATIFLIGFLITGVISDYKESEKIPGDLASSLEVIFDEAYIINKNKKAEASANFLNFYDGFLKSLHEWFFKKVKTYEIMTQLNQMNDHFAELESLAQANFITRMKNEQSNVRKIITRIHTIRETSFVQSAYAIVESLSFFLIVGLLMVKLEPFYESAFFTMLVSFMVLYMIFLIKDLDNPFEYDKYGETSTEVSLKPLIDMIARVSGKR